MPDFLILVLIVAVAVLVKQVISLGKDNLEITPGGFDSDDEFWVEDTDDYYIDTEVLELY